MSSNPTEEKAVFAPVRWSEGVLKMGADTIGKSRVEVNTGVG